MVSMPQFPRIYNPYVISAISTMGAMLFGFDISSMSSFISQPPYKEFFDNPDSTTQGGITSSMAGGSFLSCLIAGNVSDKIGRKLTIIIASFIWIIGAAIQCSSRNQAQLIAGRVIGGMGVGLASSQVPVYISEMSPKHIRGRLVSMFQWSVTWGIFIMFLVGYGCSFVHNDSSFRIAWGIQMVPGAILGFGMLFLPESPRWLAQNDRWEESIEIIANIQGNGDPNSPNVLVEVEEVKETVRIARESAQVTILDLFKKGNLNRTSIGIWAQIWQQMCGMNVIMYYVVYIFQMAGYEGDTSLIPSLAQYIINVGMTVPALLFVDKWGRRNTMLVGCFLMLAFHFSSGAIMAVYGVPKPNGIDKENPNITIQIPKSSKKAANALIACAYLFTASYAPTMGPTSWLYVSEIFPLNQRAIANGLCAAFNWICNFALGMFTPVAFANITWKTYMMFGTFCSAAFIQIFLQFPETKDKTLEEIEQVFESGIPAWRTGSFQVRRPSVSDVQAVNGGRAPSMEKQVGNSGHNEHGFSDEDAAKETV